MNMTQTFTLTRENYLKIGTNEHDTNVYIDQGKLPENRYKLIKPKTIFKLNIKYEGMNTRNKL